MISEVQPCRASIKNRVIENSLKITMTTYSKEKNTKLTVSLICGIAVLCKKLNIFQTSFINNVVKRELHGFVPLKQATTPLSSESD